MNNIVFEEIPNNIKLIGSGAYGKCYCTKDNRVLKLFYDSVRNLYPNIERMSSIQSSYFEFPKELVFLKEISESAFKGYFMNYIEGDYFDVINGNTDINKFIISLCKLENEIRRLTLKYRIKMYDLAYDNVLLTKDTEIKVIDTDLYTFSDCLSDEKLLLTNMSELCNLISENFIKVNERKFTISRLRSYAYDFYDGYINPSAYLFEIMEEIRKITREEVKDYNSFNEGVKLILNR